MWRVVEGFEGVEHEKMVDRPPGPFVAFYKSPESGKWGVVSTETAQQLSALPQLCAPGSDTRYYRATAAPPSVPGPSEPAALEAAKAGNEVFKRDPVAKGLREALAKGQRPRIAIVTCADSRVDPARILSMDLGDVFVVRNAGNVCNGVSIGSVEYAVEHLHASLVIIMGHGSCGAVTACLDMAQKGQPLELRLGHDRFIHKIMHKIMPSVGRVVRGPSAGSADILELCIRANIEDQVRALVTDSAIVREKLEHEAGFAVWGAYYDLKSGGIEWLHEVNASNAASFDVAEAGDVHSAAVAEPSAQVPTAAEFGLLPDAALPGEPPVAARGRKGRRRARQEH